MTSFRFEFRNEKHRAKWFNDFINCATSETVLAYLCSPLCRDNMTMSTAVEIQTKINNGTMSQDEFENVACKAFEVKRKT